jgi:hypothetical protein
MEINVQRGVILGLEGFLGGSVETPPHDIKVPGIVHTYLYLARSTS